MFAELLAQAGVTEVLELRSGFGFLGFHGGSLEQVTDVIATEAAERAGASVYAVAQPPELRWHIPSRLVSADASPRLAAFLDHVEVAVAVHGYGREGRWTDVLVGGGNRELAEVVGAALVDALPDHSIVTDMHRVPAELRGLHPDNPVNRVRGGGVQLELPPRARGLGPVWTGWEGPGHAPPVEAVIGALARVALDSG